MKLQELTESMNSRLNDQSILRSELAKKEKLVEELRKEIEVNICNYCIVCVDMITFFVNIIHIISVSNQLIGRKSNPIFLPVKLPYRRYSSLNTSSR